MSESTELFNALAARGIVLGVLLVTLLLVVVLADKK